MTPPSVSPFGLDGKTILVTGASSGIGRQTAIICAERGARLIITGRDAGRLDETYRQLPGDRHVQVTADLTIEDERNRLTGMGSVDGLVHCAGQQKHCLIRQLNEQKVTDLYAINFLAPLMLTQRLLYSRAIAPGASIVFLLSTAAHTGTPGVAAYSASKAGLFGIVKCLALEQAKHKIRVNGISPSATETPMWAANQTELEAQKKRHPLGLGTPQDVAWGVVYLLSDASRWVTGTTLVMDGGAVV